MLFFCKSSVMVDRGFILCMQHSALKVGLLRAFRESCVRDFFWKKDFFKGNFLNFSQLCACEFATMHYSMWAPNKTYTPRFFQGVYFNKFAWLWYDSLMSRNYWVYNNWCIGFINGLKLGFHFYHQTNQNTKRKSSVCNKCDLHTFKLERKLSGPL